MSGTDILSMVIVGLASTLVYGSISLYLANDLLQGLVDSARPIQTLFPGRDLERRQRWERYC